MWLVQERGLLVVNVDATVMLEEPKLRPYVLAMRENIAETIGVEINCVSVKAKTGEGLGSVGQGLAVKAQAVVLLTREVRTESGSDRVTSSQAQPPADSGN